MITRIWRASWLTVVVLQSATLWAQGEGGIAGRILDETGAEYRGGARITAVLHAVKDAKFVPFIAHGASTPEGSYRLGPLRPGKYDVCVQALNGDYVESCRWGRANAVPTVAAGAVVNLDIRLEKGKVFSIEVDDNEQFLDRHEGKSPGGILSIGVVGPSREFVRANIASDNKLKRNYRVVVPVLTKFQVRVQSPLFDAESENEAQEPLRVVQEVDREFAANEASKGIKIQLKRLKSLGAAR